MSGPLSPPVARPGEGSESAAAVLANRPFLLLWLSQVSTQVGGNMVLFGLTVVIYSSTRSNAAVSLLLLTFLVPAVVFSAVAGVYVDRFDRRVVLVVTNVLRGVACLLLFLAGDNAALIFLLNVSISTITTFFAPAEAAMIPFLVPRGQLIAANGIFTLTMNVAFALGFALLGPLIVTVAGPPVLLLLVGALYLAAGVFCFTLPGEPGEPGESGEAGEAGEASRGAGVGTAHGEAAPGRRLMDELGVAEAEEAVGTMVAQLREGLDYIVEHRSIGWSLTYLGITASLIGVLGVLGPAFATKTLGLAPKDFVVVVLPLGLGVVTGILALNSYGRYLPRRRVIEGGLIALGLLLAILSIAGPITQFLQRRLTSTGGLADVGSAVSLLSVVVGLAFLAGVSYALVAIPSQTQLQEDLPEEVRGRVFGVLNMLVSIASLLPIIVVGPIADFVGTTSVIFLVALLIGFAGISSVLGRGPLLPEEARATAEQPASGPVDPATVYLAPERSRTGRATERSDPASVAVAPPGAEVAGRDDATALRRGHAGPPAAGGGRVAPERTLWDAAGPLEPLDADGAPGPAAADPPKDGDGGETAVTEAVDLPVANDASDRGEAAGEGSPGATRPEGRRRGRRG